MDPRKSVRDVIIIVLIIVIGVLFFQSKRSGPASGPAADPHDGHDHSQDDQMAMPAHGGLQHVLSDGDTLFKLGDYTVGQDWFDETVESNRARYASEGMEMDEDVAVQMARIDAMNRACSELTVRSLADEKGITIDEDLINQQEVNLREDEAAMQTMEDMGLSMKRLRYSWEMDQIEPLLLEQVVAIMQMTPEDMGAEQAYVSFIRTKAMRNDYEFIDPEMEELFNETAAAMESDGMTAPHGEMQAPHGDMGGAGSEETETSDEQGAEDTEM
ncbi:MAG TPA: hypothetical protein VGB30_11665 [bacterium]|jgi:hypothetical protein